MPLPITTSVCCLFKVATLEFINDTCPKPITVKKSKKKRLKPCGSRRLCLFFCGVENQTAMPDPPMLPTTCAASRSSLTERAAHLFQRGLMGFMQGLCQPNARRHHGGADVSV